MCQSMSLSLMLFTFYDVFFHLLSNIKYTLSDEAICDVKSFSLNEILWYSCVDRYIVHRYSVGT